MTGLDCNILVQLALADHPANARTVTLVEAEVRTPIDEVRGAGTA